MERDYSFMLYNREKENVTPLKYNKRHPHFQPMTYEQASTCIREVAHELGLTGWYGVIVEIKGRLRP